MDKITLGIDIAKKKFDVALLLKDKYHTKEFANNKDGTIVFMVKA